VEACSASKHFTRTANDVGDAIAASLADLKADTAFDAIPGCTTTTHSRCLFRLALNLLNRRLELHLIGRSGLSRFDLGVHCCVEERVEMKAL